MLTKEEKEILKSLMYQKSSIYHTIDEVTQAVKSVFVSNEFGQKIVFTRLCEELELTGESIDKETAISRIKNLINHANLDLYTETYQGDKFNQQLATHLNELTLDELQEYLEKYLDLDYKSLSEEDEREGNLEACIKIDTQQLFPDKSWRFQYHATFYDEWSSQFNVNTQGFELSIIVLVDNQSPYKPQIQLPKFTSVTAKNLTKIHQIYTNCVLEAQKVLDECLPEIQKRIKREQLAILNLQATIKPALEDLLGHSLSCALWTANQIKIQFNNGCFLYELPQEDNFHFDLLLNAITQIVNQDSYRSNCYYGFHNTTFELHYENNTIVDQNGDCYVSQ